MLSQGSQGGSSNTEQPHKQGAPCKVQSGRHTYHDDMDSTLFRDPGTHIIHRQESGINLILLTFLGGAPDWIRPSEVTRPVCLLRTRVPWRCVAQNQGCAEDAENHFWIPLPDPVNQGSDDLSDEHVICR